MRHPTRPQRLPTVCGLLSHSPLSTARDVCLGDRYRVTAETSYLSLRQAAAPMREPLQWSACSAPPETHAKVRFGRGRNHRCRNAGNAMPALEVTPNQTRPLRRLWNPIESAATLRLSRNAARRRFVVLTWQAAEPSQTELRNIHDHVAVGFFSSEEFLQPSESTDDTGAVALEMRRQIARAIGEDGAECGGEERPARSVTRSPSSAAEARAGICSRFSMCFVVRLGAKAMWRLP